MARSKPLLSPDRRYRAFADVVAKATHTSPGQAGRETQDCENVSRLLVGERGNEARGVFEQKPSGNLKGNTLVIVDWSRDSRFLLAQLSQWVYESHGWSNEVVLYDTQEKKVIHLDLNEVFGKSLGKDCAAYGEVLGFSEDSQIVFKAHPAADEIDAELNGPFCVKREGLWLVHPQTRKIQRLSPSFKVKKNGLVRLGAGHTGATGRNTPN
ncbi:MAG: hypothetical protein ACRD2Q_11610 [Terriglobales bacterium]